MNVQDKLERILREMHIMISKGPTLEEDGDFVVVHKRDMQRLFNGISQAISEMLEQYEATEESRNRAEMEAEKHRNEIIKNANRQAEDIYAASVIYTDDALGRIQDIIDEAEKSTREVLSSLNRAMEEEKRQVRSNQLELKTQLEDLKETAKYMKIIEERNREIARAKARIEEGKKPNKYRRRLEKESEEVSEELTEEMPEERITYEKPVIKINEEYFEKAGLTPEGLPKDMMEEMSEEKITYEKPVIKINEEYFEKAGIPIEKEDDSEEKTENPEGTENVEGADGAEEQEGFAEELTPEMEAQLKAELDMEYFEWQEDEPKEETKKSRLQGLFPFGRKS